MDKILNISEQMQNDECASVIEKVVAFYKDFNNTFRKIDNLYALIDNNDGYDEALIHEIINTLLKYHIEISNQLPEKVETKEPVHKIFANLEKSKDINDYIIATSNLQKIIHNYLTHDNEWRNQPQHFEIIKKLLEFCASVNFEKDKNVRDKLYTTVRILRELVADCAINACGLMPLLKWHYGTTNYALLSVEYQLTILLNQAILTDRMCISLQVLETHLRRLDKLIDSFADLNWFVYYVAGLLNFKIHRYPEARKYFKKVEEESCLKDSKEFEKTAYFHSVLLIAYSYEYNNEFSHAIEKLGISVDEIKKVLENYTLFELDLDDSNYIQCKKVLNAIIEMASKNKESLCAMYFAIDGKFLNNATSVEALLDLEKSNNSREIDIHLEILHAFAHSLNEYAIDAKRKGVMDSNIAKILRFSRCLMKFISNYKVGYSTCYATMHGEYQDHIRALELLFEAEELITRQAKNDKSIGLETARAEISFFKYYFAKESNSSNDDKTDESIEEDPKKNFEQYYIKNADDDARCYLKIFEFKNALREFVFKFLDSIKLINADPNSRSLLKKIPETLTAQYEDLCGQVPTMYMNVNVRAEMRIVQRIFVCIRKIRALIEAGGSEQLLYDLKNACRRFSRVKAEFGLGFHGDDVVGISELSEDDEKLKNESNEMFYIFSSQGILHCLLESDSIFILAPISGVVVYQYQTGEIDRLFSMNRIDGIAECILKKRSTAIQPQFSLVADIKKGFSAKRAQIGNPQIKGINWAEKPECVIKVYNWQDKPNVESRLIVFDGISYVRRIVDSKHFNETVKALHRNWDRSCQHICDQGHFNDDCWFGQIKVENLEIISEQQKNNNSAFYLSNRNSTDTHYFIVETANKMSPEEMHATHIWIKAAEISYYQPNDKVIKHKTQITKEFYITSIVNKSEDVRHVNNNSIGDYTKKRDDYLVGEHMYDEHNKKIVKFKAQNDAITRLENAYKEQNGNYSQLLSMFESELKTIIEG